MRSYFDAIFEKINKTESIVEKLDTFSDFIELMKESELAALDYSLIDKAFKILFKGTHNGYDSSYIKTFTHLINNVEKTVLWKNYRSIIEENALKVMEFTKGIKKCPSCYNELDSYIEVKTFFHDSKLYCPQCKKDIKYESYEIDEEFKFLKRCAELGFKDSKKILKNKIKKYFEIIERYFDNVIQANQFHIDEEQFLMDSFLNKPIIDRIIFLTNRQYLIHFSDEKIDELYINNKRVMKVAINRYEDFFESLTEKGFHFFPWKQSKFRNTKYLKCLAINLLKYTSEVLADNLESDDFYGFEIEEIVSFFDFLGGLIAVNVLKEEIVNFVLRRKNANDSYLLFIAGYVNIVEQDQINQIIEQMDNNLLDGIIGELLYIIDLYNQKIDPHRESHEYLTGEMMPKFDETVILKALHRFLVNPKINILYGDVDVDRSYLILRKEFPEDFRDALYRHLLNCSSIRKLLIHCEFEEDDNRIRKSLFSYNVIKDFFYKRKPDLITLLISKFKIAKEFGPRMHSRINFFYRKSLYIKYEDFVMKISQILENGNKEDLDCIIKLKFFLHFRIHDFKSIIDNPRLKFKEKFVEILKNRIDDLSYYIDFFNQYIEIIGKENFRTIFDDLDEDIQISFRDELIVKLNTHEENYPNFYRYWNFDWLNKHHFDLFYKLFKLISKKDVKEKFKFKYRRFGTGYKDYLEFNAAFGSNPRLSGINEIIGFEEIKNLKVLKLIAHFFDEFDITQINHLKRLELLELAGNNIKDVKLLKNFNKLKFLNLGQNKISELMSFKNLSSLEYINLSNNEIFKLPDSIGSLSSLIYLDLSHNKIKKLPETIGNLNSLEYLDLSYNPLSYIPTSITTLKSLKGLLLWDTPFSNLPKTSLPEPFKKLKQLGIDVYIYKGERMSKDPVALRTKIELKITKWNFLNQTLDEPYKSADVYEYED